MLWGCFWIPLGIAITCTIIGAPIGILLMWVGARPWVRLEQRMIAAKATHTAHNKEQTKIRNRNGDPDVEYDEEGSEVPWEM